MKYGLPFINTHLRERIYSSEIRRRNHHSNNKIERITSKPNYNSIHLLTDEYLNKDIIKLRNENEKKFSFLQMYNQHKYSKPLTKNQLNAINQPSFLPNKTNYTLSTMSTFVNHKNTFNSSNYSIEGNYNNKTAMNQDHDTVNNETINNFDQENNFNTHHDSKSKEFDMIFKNSIKMLQKIKKQKKTTKKLTSNKYSNCTRKEINEIQNKMSYLNGVINYLYPKIICMKTAENEKNFLNRINNRHNNEHGQKKKIDIKKNHNSVNVLNLAF